MSNQYHGHPRPEMIGFVPPEAGRVLDIGCGQGRFGAGLKQSWRDQGRTLEVWGLELDNDAANRAAEVLDHVLTGDVTSLLGKLPEARFDTIIFNDVLEHLAEPGEVLRAVQPLLASGGCLVASIPNVRYFFNVLDLTWNGRWDYTDEGILDRTHLRFFTRSSMLNLMIASGYRVDRIEGIHPTGSLKFKLANLLSLGRFSEMRYLQFALVARPVEEG